MQNDIMTMTIICGLVHQLHVVTHDNKGGNDIQLVRHFLNVNGLKKKKKDCVPNIEAELRPKSFGEQSREDFLVGAPMASVAWLVGLESGAGQHYP